MATITISIVEDLAEVRTSLENLIRDSAEFLFLSGYPNAEAAQKGIPHEQPDLVIMDINSKEATSNPAANQQLSEARAQAVKAQMIHSGVTEGRLTAKGYGDTKPMTTNDTPEGRATNRRVEFVRQ